MRGSSPRLCQKLGLKKKTQPPVTKTRSHKLSLLKYLSNSCFGVFESWWFISFNSASTQFPQVVE